MQNKKIIINLTEDWFFVSHFLGRAVEAKKSGYEVYISCNESNKRKFIEKNHDFEKIATKYIKTWEN